MGYYRSFEGEFFLDRPLLPEHIAYLTKFSETRRMKRNPDEAEKLPDPLRQAVGLAIGMEGAYFVGGLDPSGQGDDPSVLDHNIPPQGQPGLWCNWVPSFNGHSIIWDGSDKFPAFIEWIEYLIDHFLKPWSYVLNGSVTWQGEDEFDEGTISVEDNVVEIYQQIAVVDKFGRPRRLNVFLCHASGDKPTIRLLYKKLQKIGVTPWLDEQNLLPGQDWETEIEKAIKHTDAILVCLSQQSISKIGFVQKEIKRALDVADEQPEGSIFIIPLKLEECKIPDRLARWQGLDYYKRGGFARLEHSLREKAISLSEKE